MTIPTFHEDDVRLLVGRKNLRQGSEYFRTGSIINAQRQGSHLKANP